MTTDSTILLVHGAWHGGWCWEKVMPILEAAGREVVAIDLPTVHAPNKAELGLDDDTRAVSDAIAAIGGPVTVVGHSYGGIPVSQGAASPEVRHIVYIAAFVLDAGESLVGSVGGVEPDWWHVDGPLATAGDENQTPQSLFFGDVEAAEADAAAARLTAQAVAPFRTEQTEPAWKSTSSTYLVTESDAIFPVFAQEALAGRAGSRIERLNTSHSPFLSQPEAVAEIILRAARAADEAS